MTATTQPVELADAKGASRCVRHSYHRGSQKGTRTCRRCGQIEAPSTSAETAEATTPLAEVLVLETPFMQEHSPLGASSAERWMNCPGSVTLSETCGGSDDKKEEPDYRRDGVEAHALAAWCLNEEVDTWEAPLDQFPSLTEDMMRAVQTYLDFVRGLPGRYHHIEERVHRPEFHPHFYGTMDFAAINARIDHADFVDYKHGVGVVVEVERNPQLMYYAYGMIGDDAMYPDDMTISLHVVQPRAEWVAPIRSWTTTAGEIRKWAWEVLYPAMERTAHERYLSMGEWCRFCPAKLVCPAMACLADEHSVAERGEPLEAFTPEKLGEFYAKSQALKMYVRAIEEETMRRVLNGTVVPGVKTVAKRSVRVWKEGAPIEATFGDAAWQPRQLISPAGADKLPGGKVFSHEWAYQPEAGLTIALENDPRKAVEVKSATETFGAAIAALENA